MRSRLATLALVSATLLLAGCTASPPPAPETPSASAAPDVPAEAIDDSFTPLVAQVLSEPRGVPSTDGRVHVAYELHLSNMTSQSATIQRIDVRDQNDDSVETLDGDEIDSWVRILGASSPGRTVGPGQGALVWLDVVVDSMDELPTTLSHDVTFDFSPGAPPIIPEQMTERLAVTPVDPAPAVVIGPPLKGAGWFNGNSCCTVTPHRAAINPINGSLYAPERYAIDYVRLDSSGSFLDGPNDELSSYPYFGSEIIAVGDGPIVSMRFDLPEQKPGADPTGLTLDEYGGNHIVQSLGNGVYAFYAHLQTGNPTGVEVGQQLKKGETISLLGNTGNTDSPHLHFHLMDSPSPLGSNGIPFVIESFDLTGTVPADELATRIAAGGPFTLDSADAGERTDQYPLWLTVSDYPE
ncbi:M23 family metallopeptidase [Microbacterium sp. 1P10UB]|uniref:peptidoglycan DD-metalloendopeptidase family protein n=1 Tax=unclassified Microbacterium TaxID=2609290 RepID=UPI0039A302D7